MKYYFRHEDSDLCHLLSYFKDEMRDLGITQMEVFEAVIDHDVNDHFFCQAVKEVCEKSINNIPCGKECPDYDPRNGKSGRCRFHTNCYTSGEKITLKIEGGTK